MVNKLPFLSDEHHYAIASVAIRAAQLDTTIETVISTLFPSAALTSAFILKNMNGDRYVGLLEEMLLDLNPHKAEIIRRAFLRIRDLRVQRNELLHWLYGATENPTVAKYALRRPHRKHQERTKTAEEVEAVAEELMDMVLVVSALGSLSPRLRASPHEPEQAIPNYDFAWHRLLERFEKGERVARSHESSQE